jgi:cell division septation protein DedD
MCIISAGCSSGSMEMRRVGHTGFGDAIDPFDYGDEFLRAVEDDPKPGTADQTPENNVPTQPGSSLLTTAKEPAAPSGSASQAADNTGEVRSGYRVQIGTLNSRESADRLAELARSRTELPVYVVYLRPVYRVHVGDFVRKSDAEACVLLMKEKRFRDSIWVYTNINSQ